jgi:predicted HicB family RNase H-like nuclease
LIDQRLVYTGTRMKRGRPPLDPAARLIPVSVRLTPTQHEILCKHAQAARVSLNELIRRELQIAAAARRSRD